MLIEDFSRERMKQLMEDKDMTAYKLAKLSGFPKSTVGNYLRGSSALNPIFLDAFCKVVGISMAEFYEGY